MYSNRYIFIYSTIMVIIVAAVLSTAAMFLKPYQEANVRIEKIQAILSSANIESTKANAEDFYNKYITSEIVFDQQGEAVGIYKNGMFEKGDVRAFDVNLKEILKEKEDLENGLPNKNPVFPFFIAEKDGQTLYIIPLYGKGLWGPLWGNIALKSDWKTIAGATFGHKGETPGLGAEIDQKFFQQQFIGKTIFDGQGNFTSVKTVKGGIAQLDTEQQTHGVDAISGGTITSNGVSDMLKNCLENYVPYIQKQQ